VEELDNGEKILKKRGLAKHYFDRVKKIVTLHSCEASVDDCYVEFRLGGGRASNWDAFLPFLTRNIRISAKDFLKYSGYWTDKRLARLEALPFAPRR